MIEIDPRVEICMRKTHTRRFYPTIYSFISMAIFIMLQPMEITWLGNILTQIRRFVAEELLSPAFVQVLLSIQIKALLHSCLSVLATKTFTHRFASLK